MALLVADSFNLAKTVGAGHTTARLGRIEPENNGRDLPVRVRTQTGKSRPYKNLMNI
jgi:hypothetical protein